MKAPNKIELTTWIKDGRWTTNTSVIRSFNESWEDCQITVTLHKKRNKVSKNQHSYYWSCIVPIAINGFLETSGELKTSSEVHEFLLANFNYEEVVMESTGEILRKVRRSKDNTTVQAEQYYMKCRQFIKDYFNIEVPLPNQSIKIEFE